THTQNHGTGLALAICKRMIEKMSGEVLLNSIPGKGSEFKVILRDVPWTTHKIENVEIPPTEPPVALSVSKRVLVVDDVAMNLKVMSALLNKLGQHVITSTSADEAWNILQNTPVDVLLTDLWMPGMNGAELTSKIRQSKKFDNLVTVAVTADVQGEKTFDMSAFDFVMTKPVTIDKLQRFIAKISNSVD
ncbi:MAG: response regulator, partial [Thermoguttaceae bacterium]|nr:response regulator [Thermoguttaceae bacterium]